MRTPALLLLIALPAAAQFWSELANPKVEVTLTHPPELGLKIDRVAFLPGRDPDSRELADTLAADLVSSKAMEVVDRSHLDAVLREQELGMSGYVDPATIASLGRLLGPTALVVVNVNRSALSRTQATKEEKVREGTTEKTRLIRSSITSLDFNATVQVIDLTTGRVYGAQRIEEAPSLSATSDQGWPAHPRDADVRRLAYQAARARIHRLLLPWTEVRRLTFFDDKVFGMAQAHALLENRRTADALQRALQGLEESKRDKDKKAKYYPRAHYNVGILHFIEGRYEEARPYLQQALDMDPGASIFKTAYRECLEALDLQARMRQVEERSAALAKPASPAPETGRPDPKPSAEERLKRLQDLHRKGLLNEREYEAKKAEILKEL